MTDVFTPTIKQQIKLQLTPTVETENNISRLNFSIFNFVVVVAVAVLAKSNN